MGQVGRPRLPRAFVLDATRVRTRARARAHPQLSHRAALEYGVDACRYTPSLCFNHSRQRGSFSAARSAASSP